MTKIPSSSVPRDSASNHALLAVQKKATQFSVRDYCRKLGFSAAAEQFLHEGKDHPSRRPNGFKANSPRLPLPEFGHTLATESLSLEFPFALITKARPDVLEIFEQAPRVKIQGRTEDGSVYTFPYTADFIVITTTGVEIYELEHTSESASYYLSAKNRYKAVNGRYTSPPVEAHFAALGFRFSIVSEADIGARFVKNARLLHGYQVGHPRDPISDKERQTILKAVADQPGIRLSDTPLDSDPRTVEVVYHMIAKGELFTHMSECPLDQPAMVRLFSVRQHESAFLLVRQIGRRPVKDLASLGYHLRVGSALEFRGKEYVVSRTNAKEVVLVDEKGVARSVPHQVLLDLAPRIGGISNAEKTLEHLMATAPQADLIEFQVRYSAILPYLPGGARANESPKMRTIRRWKAAYLREEARTGVGLSGIFPAKHKCGNRSSRFSELVERLINHQIEKHYFRAGGCSMVDLHLHIMALGNRLRITKSDLPTYTSIFRRCASLDPHKKAFIRDGKKLAQLVRPFYPNISPLGSPHGDKSMMVCHCDSTQLDLAYTHDAQTVEIKHLWHTKMVDAYDGRTLSWYTSTERPSAFALEELMGLCVERHGALPPSVVVDWGSEHRNTWLEKTMARLGVIVIYRPKSTPINGAPVESHFAKLNKELIHNLRGTTKLMVRARVITKAVDPRNNTIWSENLIRELLDVYYEVTNDAARRSRPSPNAIAQACEEEYGKPPVQVVDVKMFRDILLPYVDGITRKVSPRGTIRVGYDDFSDSELIFFAGQFVNVRQDPRDPRRVLVDHPTERRVIPCKVVNLALRHADSPEAAIAMVEEADRNRKTGGAALEQARVGFTEQLMGLEQRALDEAKPKRKARSVPVTPVVTADELAEIIPLRLVEIVRK